jgi:hypothetical protein
MRWQGLQPRTVRRCGLHCVPAGAAVRAALDVDTRHAAHELGRRLLRLGLRRRHRQRHRSVSHSAERQRWPSSSGVRHATMARHNRAQTPLSTYGAKVWRPKRTSTSASEAAIGRRPDRALLRCQAFDGGSVSTIGSAFNGASGAGGVAHIGRAQLAQLRQAQPRRISLGKRLQLEPGVGGAAWMDGCYAFPHERSR